MSEEQIIWYSPTKEKGAEGLNDAAINSFNGNIINSFVREMFQNSNDARNIHLPVNPETSKRPPLVIKMGYEKVNREDLPAFEMYTDKLKLIRDTQPKGNEHPEFFKNAIDSIDSGQEITVFRFEDYNTEGLQGDDGDSTKSFNSLVLSEGYSVKSSTQAGGSFGIGKNAIYGFSKTRTVFYASHNPAGEYIFQGVGKLASHKDGDRTTERRLYCGIGTGCESIRDIQKIPSEHRKLFERSEPGLTQIALAPYKDDNWVELFICAILRNYWLLILEGDLVVEIKDDDGNVLLVNNETLNELMDKYYPLDDHTEPNNVQPEGNPNEFYRCYTGKAERYVKEFDIKHIGKVVFSYCELENKNNNRIAFMRNGMTVFTEVPYGFGSLGFCGVLECKSPKGAEILRQMEPPEHNAFHPERLAESSSEFTAQDGKKMINDIKGEIRKCLKEILDRYRTPSEKVAWLDNLLESMMGDSEKGGLSRKKVESENETTQRITQELNLSVSLDTKNGNEVIDQRETDEKKPGENEGKIPGKGKIPPSINTGTKKVRKPRPSSGKTSYNIRQRTYRTGKYKEDPKTKRRLYEYNSILTAPDKIEKASILLAQEGDAGAVVSFSSMEAYQEGAQLKVAAHKNMKGNLKGFRISDISVPGKISIYVDECNKSSFTLIGE